MASRGKLDLRQDVFHIPDHLSIALGLRWEFIGDKPVDLDVSCVSFKDSGECVEAVFFNNLHSKNDYMSHSGDNTTGEAEEEDDENLFFEMAKIPPDVHFIMVCVTSYTGVEFTVVEKATCRLVNRTTKQTVHEFGLGVVGNHTASLLCAFSRTQVQNDEKLNTYWVMREVNLPCNGYTFVDVLPKMLDLLAVQDSDRDKCLATLPNYSVVKDAVNTNITPAQLKLGLGWDGDNDLDASLVMLSETGEYVDHVHAKYGKLRSLDNAVLHSGDKLNGYDVQGDDEFMLIDLNAIDRRVAKIYFIVLLYDGQARSLGDVPRSYVRMQNKAPKETQYRELDRYPLTSCSNATAFVFSAVVRENGSVWTYVSIKESVSAGRDWIEIFPYIRCHAKFTSKGNEYWNRWRVQAKDKCWVELTFIEARDIGPLEPHQFSCHCEAWVCDRKGKDRARTASCTNREAIRWYGENNNNEGDGEEKKKKSGTTDQAIFNVSQMDRIRVMLYEHAMVGYVDLDFSELESVVHGTALDQWFSLVGVGITGEIHLRLRTIPASEAKKRLPPSKDKELSWCVIQ